MKVFNVENLELQQTENLGEKYKSLVMEKSQSLDFSLSELEEEVKSFKFLSTMQPESPKNVKMKS